MAVKMKKSVKDRFFSDHSTTLTAKEAGLKVKGGKKRGKK